jgi:glycerol-3-phosphate acyltransferase PlsX
MLWIAVDAMGGDFAPRLVVDGAIAATRQVDLGVALVGRADLVETEVARHADVDHARVRIVDASDIVTMEESPPTATRRRCSAPDTRERP